MFGSVSSPREGSARKPLAFPSPRVPEVDQDDGDVIGDGGDDDDWGLSYYTPWWLPPLKIWQNSSGPVRAPRHETNSFYYKMSTLPKGWQINTSINTIINTRGGSPLGP